MAEIQWWSAFTIAHGATGTSCRYLANMTISKRFTIAFLLIFYGYFLFVHNSLKLAMDEAYYWYWAKNLEWSYFDHPPLIAYTIAFFTKIGGDTEFFVRLGAWFLTLGTAALNFLTVQTLFPNDKELPWQVLLIYHLTLLLAACALIFTPDTLLIFFWSLAVYSGAKLITENKSSWWYLGGIALGFGLLSKYSMILIAPCQFIFLILSQRHRHWLKHPAPYLSFLLGLFIFLPVIYWNSQHSWLSFLFQLGQGFANEATKNPSLDLLKYIAGQAGIMTPLLFIMFTWYSMKGGIDGFKQQNNQLLYLFMLSWPILIFFGISSTRGELAEANWAAPAYVTGIPLMWVMYRSSFSKSKHHRAFAITSIGVAALISLLVHLHINTGVLPISPQNDPFFQLHSWQNLGEKVDQVIQDNPHETGYFAMSDKGTLLAEVIFYSELTTGFDPFMPERYLFLDNPNQNFKGKNAIIVTRRKNAAYKKVFAPYFEEVTKVGECPHIYRDTAIKGYGNVLYLGKGFRGNWKSFDEIKGR